jgi:hypothetical protein
MRRSLPNRRRTLKAIAATIPLSMLAACELMNQHNLTKTGAHTMQNSSDSHHGSNDGIHDFDFLVGSWRIENRRLTKRLQHNDDWENFEATQQNWALPGGIGNYDNYIAETWRPGFVGMSLRLFNPQTRLWSIYWLSNQNAGLNEAGVLLPPVVGKFENGVGIFECDEELDGKPVKTRFTWSDIKQDSAVWEQSMSPDNGQTWEMNWRMQMYRVA